MTGFELEDLQVRGHIVPFGLGMEDGRWRMEEDGLYCFAIRRVLCPHGTILYDAISLIVVL
jgi:hypothetical protein